MSWTYVISACAAQQLLAASLRAGTSDARVDQLVADAEDQAADDRLVDVLVHDGVLLQCRADLLLHLFELLAA